LLKEYAVPNDIYTFSGDPMASFKQALDTANKILKNNAEIKFEIDYNNQTNKVTLVFDRPNKIEDYDLLFGPGTIPGYLTTKDMLTIQDLAKELPSDGIFVEIGSFLGKSTVEWAKSLKGLNKNYKIIAIDSFNSHIDILRDLLKKAEFDIPESNSHIEMFQYYTQDYSIIKPLEAFFNQDFVFDQTVAGVFEDSDNSQRTLSFALPYWWKRIVPGGILSGHNYTMRDVQVSVDSFALLNNLTVHKAGEGSSIWWIKK